MQKITSESILSVLILHNPSLMPFMHLSGVCRDFKDKTIRQVSKELAINESYLLNLLLAFLDNKFVPSETFPSYGILQLTDLSSVIYPYFLAEYDVLTYELHKMLKAYKQSKKEESNRTDELLNDSFDTYRKLLSNRCKQQEQTVIPHVLTVYELYYSPDFTSGKTDLMNYSIDFYDAKIQLLQRSFEDLRNLLEQNPAFTPSNLRFALKLNAFDQLHQQICLQDNLEQKLLKPLVLHMEESIIHTFRKRNGSLRRSNYLYLPVEMTSSDVLSPREKEVLQLVAHGLMNKEIADHLNIGLTTVITHRKNIIGKLGIKTIPGLTVYAYTHGYMEDSMFTIED